MDEQAVTTSHLDGEPVPKTSELVPHADDRPTVEDDASVDHDGSGAQDDEVQVQQASSGGSCFVATAPYETRHHSDVVTLRRL